MMPAPSADGQLRTHLFIAPMREFGSEGKHWSPCASTLVTGETEAVLTDTGHIKSDVRALGDMIERTGKRLTTIFITHGHLDHFLGIGRLMQRFPDARPVATPAVVADIKASVADQEQQWQRRFGSDRCLSWRSSRPGREPRSQDDHRQYIRDFRDAVAASSSAGALRHGV
jgi:glyoxylase-like metal-dependent hydrolase (beta-lactamase superfamily II)